MEIILQMMKYMKWQVYFFIYKQKVPQNRIDEIFTSLQTNIFDNVNTVV